MSSHYLELEIDELRERFGAHIAVEFDADPGEEMVRYYPDGSGYPGSPPSVEVTKVTVLGLTASDWEADRKALEAMGDGWAEYIDRVALDHVDAEMNTGGWIEEALFEKADEDCSYEPEYEPDYDDHAF